MSIATRIQRSGGGAGNDFKLQVTNLSITHDRSPIAVWLPGSQPLLLDLGQWKVSIALEGTCNFAGTDLTDGGIPIADKDDLEAIADPTQTTPWHSSTITLTDDTDSGAVVYTVKISSLKLTKRDVQNKYDFTLTCVGFLGLGA